MPKHEDDHVLMEEGAEKMMREHTVIHRVWSQCIETWKFYFNILLLLPTVHSMKT